MDIPDSGLKVLVVDDHPANLLLMAQQLGYLGLSHASASDGREGLEKWRRTPFDVLVLDCNMPHMSGYQLATAVRSEERQSGRPRCVILGYTANAQPEVRQSASAPAWTIACSSPSACVHSANAWPRSCPDHTQPSSHCSTWRAWPASSATTPEAEPASHCRAHKPAGRPGTAHEPRSPASGRRDSRAGAQDPQRGTAAGSKAHDDGLRGPGGRNVVCRVHQTATAGTGSAYAPSGESAGQELAKA